MEGTIFKKAVKQTIGHKTAPSLWQAIAEHLGKDALIEEAETQLKNDRGEYLSYMEWMKDTINIYKKYNLDHSFFQESVKSIEIHKGAHHGWYQYYTIFLNKYLQKIKLLYNVLADIS